MISKIVSDYELESILTDVRYIAKNRRPNKPQPYNGVHFDTLLTLNIIDGKGYLTSKGIDAANVYQSALITKAGMPKIPAK